MEPIGRASAGEAVRDVQRRLLGAGHRIDADELEGTFGPSTEAAVREFQHARGLPVDGLVGSETWGQLVESGYRLGDRTLYLRSPAFRGDDVRELQRLLNALGFDAGKQDGIFGPRTADGLRDFQRNVAARVDGIVGLDTVREIGRFRPTLEGPGRATVREELAAGAPGLSLDGAIVAVDAEPAGTAFADAIVEEVGSRGGRPLTLWGEGASEVSDRIRRANAAGATLLLAVSVGAEDGPACFHFGTPTTHSPMGRRLATSILASLAETTGAGDRGVHPRSVAILRETRMPAVVIELGTADASAGEPALHRMAAAALDGVETFSRPVPEPVRR